MTILKDLRKALLALLAAAGVTIALCALGGVKAYSQVLPFEVEVPTKPPEIRTGELPLKPEIRIGYRFPVKTWYWARTKDVDQQCALVPGAALEVREQSPEKGIELVYLPLNSETPRNACAKSPNGKVFRFGTNEQFSFFAKTVLCMPDEPSELCKQMIEASMKKEAPIAQATAKVAQRQ